jgi:hypothetical protein
MVLVIPGFLNAPLKLSILFVFRQRIAHCTSYSNSVAGPTRGKKIAWTPLDVREGNRILRPIHFISETLTVSLSSDCLRFEQ